MRSFSAVAPYNIGSNPEKDGFVGDISICPRFKSHRDQNHKRFESYGYNLSNWMNTVKYSSCLNYEKLQFCYFYMRWLDDFIESDFGDLHDDNKGFDGVAI